jgi:hypothetical protein
MNLKQAEKHIERLEKLFPKAFIRTTADFYGFNAEGSEQNIGLWTGFLEDGTVDEWGRDNSGTGYYVDPKLTKYLEKYNLDWEPYDSGTLFIWDWS